MTPCLVFIIIIVIMIGSHKKPVEPAEPAVSDALSSSSFAIATSYSDHVSTSSSILAAGGLTDGLTQSVSQPNVMDDVMATMSSSAQGTNQIEVPTMSLSSGLTVAINSSVSINSSSGAMTTTMSSLEPFTLATSTAVSSQSQPSIMFSISGSTPNILTGTTAGKMTPPPASFAESTDNKGN